MFPENSANPLYETLKFIEGDKEKYFFDASNVQPMDSEHQKAEQSIR